MSEKVTVSPHFVTRPFDSYDDHIPWIVSDLIRILGEKDATSVRGIFRLSASMIVVENLMEELDRGPVKDYSQYDALAVACALKTFFRQHVEKDPLIPFCFYDELIAISNIDESDAVSQLHDVVMRLPRGRQITLCYFMCFLNLVSQNSEVNMMPASNLAICIAPNILAPQVPDPSLIMYRNDCQNKVVTRMIESYDQVFEGIIFTHDSLMKDRDVEIIVRSVINDVQIDQIQKRWLCRSKSLIPYVPTHLFHDPSFKRPSEPYLVGSR